MHRNQASPLFLAVASPKYENFVLIFLPPYPKRLKIRTFLLNLGALLTLFTKALNNKA